MNRHIETKTTDNLIISKCLVCGDANAVGLVADANAKSANKNWFAFAHKKCGVKFTAKVEAETKQIIGEILDSRHVRAVEVGFEDEYSKDDSIVRVYSAVTRDVGIPHLYRVIVEQYRDNGETIVTARCNCRAVRVCRHIVRVAEVDSEREHRPINPLDLSTYKAHRFTRQAA